MGMRPTQQATKLARSRDGDPRVETPSSFLSTQTSKFGPVSRLQKLIETRSSKNFGQKSEIQFSHTVADPKRPELKNVDRVTSVAAVHDRDESDDLKRSSAFYSTKSVPNLTEKTFDRLESASKLIDSTNLSISLPFNLNEATPKPCQVDEYDDIFTPDQTVLERSEPRSLSASNALRYRSSIRIMVRPEASAANPNPEQSGGLKSGSSRPQRPIVKEQFR